MVGCIFEAVLQRHLEAWHKHVVLTSFVDVDFSHCDEKLFKVDGETKIGFGPCGQNLAYSSCTWTWSIVGRLLDNWVNTNKTSPSKHHDYWQFDNRCGLWYEDIQKHNSSQFRRLVQSVYCLSEKSSVAWRNRCFLLFVGDFWSPCFYLRHNKVLFSCWWLSGE